MILKLDPLSLTPFKTEDDIVYIWIYFINKVKGINKSNIENIWDIGNAISNT